MATIPVKYYHNNMAGAPQINSGWGDLTTMLDAVLVDGFNAKTASDVQQLAGVCTVTFATAHGFRANQIISVSGAAQADYNGEFRVISATTLTLTYAVLNNPTSPAAGTIVVKAAPLNWERKFSSGTKRAYRSTNLLSNKPFLRVDDGLDPAWTTTYSKYAKVTMAENMTDIDTFVGQQAPYNALDPMRNHVGSGSGTTAYGGWAKWYYNRYLYTGTAISDSNGSIAQNKNWRVVGDDRGFYFFIEQQTGYGFTCYAFTDFDSYRQGDGYNTFMACTDQYVQAGTNLGSASYIADVYNYMNRGNDATGKFILKDSTQVGSYTSASIAMLNPTNAQAVSGYSGGWPWPNPPDYSLIISPCYLSQGGAGGLRGKLPGIMWVHNNNPGNDMDEITGVASYPGRRFVLLSVAYSSVPYQSKFALDITGPWW